MQLYMTTHKKQQLVNDEWVDVVDYSNYTLFVVANNDDEALVYAKSALMKINSKTKENIRYVLDMLPKHIMAISVEHNLNNTNITGIWE